MFLRAIAAASLLLAIGCTESTTPTTPTPEPPTPDHSEAHPTPVHEGEGLAPPPPVETSDPLPPRAEPQHLTDVVAHALRLQRGEHFDMMFGQLSSSPLLSNRFSVEAWVRWKLDDDELSIMGNLWGCLPDDERSCCWVLQVKKARDKALLQIEYADLQGRPHLLDAVTLPVDDRWHHLLVQNNQDYLPAKDAIVKVFVDGRLVTSHAHGTPFKMRLAQRFFVGPANDRKGSGHIDVRAFYYEPSGRNFPQASFEPPEQLSFAPDSQKVYGLYDFSLPYADRVADTGEYPRNGKLFGGTWIGANTGQPVQTIKAPAESQLDPLLTPISLAPEVLSCDLALHETTTSEGKLPYVWMSSLKLEGGDPRAVKHNTLAHEIVRQAMLLAARHELGLVTRDATLGDVPPEGTAEPKAALTLRISSLPSDRVAVSVVQQGASGEASELWNKEVRMSGTQAESYATILALGEKWSREDFAALLRKFAPASKPPMPRASATVPEETSESLASMNYVDQFIAQRTLHQAVQQDGASPQLLAALAVSYANMGMLTEHHWNTAPKAFKARGLLYSQWLVSQYSQAPWGVWHRAYAWALAGVHAHALADLVAAQKLFDKAPSNSAGDPLWERPSWTALIDSYCRFDYAGLEKLMADGDSSALAALLYFFVNEDPTVVARTTSTGIAALEKNPACFRVLDSLFNIGEVSIMHRVTDYGPASHTQLLVTRLPKVPGVPEAVAEILDAEDEDAMPDEAAVVKLLKEAGAVGADQAEPSWQVLAALVAETHFTQTWCRAAFMRYYWSVPVAEYLGAVKPLVAGHPLEKYVGLIGKSGIALSWQMSGLLKNMSRSELPLAAQLKFIDTIAFIDDEKRREILAQERTPCDDTYFELLAIAGATTKNTRLKYAYRMLAFSPYSPHALALEAELDRTFTEEEAAKLEASNSSAIVLRGLIERRSGGEPLQRRLKAYVALSPDYTAYARLAQEYQQMGREDLWLATLEEFVAVPGGGLEQARARVEIAKHYLSKNQVDKAVPFAEAAAESYAAWAILCAVECYEQKGDLDKADLWFSRAAQRYPDLAASYQRWCEKHGRKPTEPLPP